MSLTLNEASAGRAQIVVGGAGGGGGGTMTAMGLKPERRVRAVKEAVEILKPAGPGERINYEGEIFTVRNYHPSWVKSAPPVVYVGANRVKMQHMAPRYADGIMLSDKMIPQVREAQHHHRLGAGREHGRPRKAFRLNNFWAWHVKESREGAQREARIWLALRGVLLRANHRVLHERRRLRRRRGETSEFFRRSSQTQSGYRGRAGADHRVAGREPVVLRVVADIDKEIERLRQFEPAGLTEIALRIYDDPAATIKVIGERVIPALGRNAR